MLFRNGRTLWKAAGVRAVEEITRVVEQAIS